MLYPEASKRGLIVNYKFRKAQIEALKKFYDSIVPGTLNVYVEFHGENEIDLEVYHDADMLIYPRPPAIFDESGINPYQYVYDSLNHIDTSLLTFAQTCKLLGWNNQTFKKIKHMLYNAKCISVENGDPVNIGFQRFGFGKYFYNLFNKPIADKVKYNDSCKYILYNDSVVLEYGGGAVGPQCFPDADDE